MKRTLLEIVQDIMNDTSSDFVNSIDDTEESVQVAQIVKSTYLAWMSNRNWEHLKRMVPLVAYGDGSRPTYMKVNEQIKELISVNYNVIKVGETKKSYQSVKYVEPDKFLFMANQLDSTATNVDTILDPSGIEVMIRNDKAPQTFTSFDDNTLVFDSYDSAIDTTLQGNKFQAMAYIIPSWTHTDAFIPDLPAEAFSGLIEEAKSKATFKLTREPDQKAEQEAARQNRWLARKNWQVAGGIKYPDYGRKSRK